MNFIDTAGKYRFRMEEVGKEIIFELETPKHLDTGLIDVDVNPWYLNLLQDQRMH